MPLISIILPVYNVEEYIETCLKSIRNQSFEKYEVIIVNDGSTDGSLAICQKYEFDSRFRIFSKENGGLSSARNYGLNYASSKYVCFVDSDDYLDKNYLSILLDNIEKNKADISVCNFYYEFNDKLVLRDSVRNGIYLFNNIDAIKEIYKFDSYGVGVWNKLFKLKLFENIKFPEGKISEDYFVMYRIFIKAEKIVYNSTPLYHYIQRVGSITKSRIIRYDVLESALEFFDFSMKYPELLDWAKCNVVFSAIGLYDTGLFNGTLTKDDKNKLLGIIKNKKYKFNNRILPKSRKRQMFLISIFPMIYNRLFLAFKKKRVKYEGR